MRFEGIELVVPGQDQLFGPTSADEPWHHVGNDRRPEPDLGLTEHGIVRRHRQIAHHHQIAPAGKTVAMHLRDDRPGMVEDLEQTIEAVGETVQGGLRSRFLREVVPRTERAAGPGNNDHPDPEVLGRLAQRTGQRPDKGGIESVQLLGSVQGETAYWT